MNLVRLLPLCTECTLLVVLQCHITVYGNLSQLSDPMLDDSVASNTIQNSEHQVKGDEAYRLQDSDTFIRTETADAVFDTGAVSTATAEGVPFSDDDIQQCDVDSDPFCTDTAWKDTLDEEQVSSSDIPENFDYTSDVQHGSEPGEVEAVIVEEDETDKSAEQKVTNDTESGNEKASNVTSHSKKANCLERELSLVKDVEILNASALLSILNPSPNITSRSTPANCCVVYFFSPYCPFSVQGSPFVNALGRSLPNIPVYGINCIEFHSVNARYGVMGTPTLLVFHNGNVNGRYNASEYSVHSLISFIHHFTNQNLTYINVTSNDFMGVLPSKVLEYPPYTLYLAWSFLLCCLTWQFLKSPFFARIKEALLNNWREAEAQHAHDD